MACLVFFAFISGVQSLGDTGQDIKEQAWEGEKIIINQSLVVCEPFEGICLLVFVSRTCLTEQLSAAHLPLVILHFLLSRALEGAAGHTTTPPLGIGHRVELFSQFQTQPEPWLRGREWAVSSSGRDGCSAGSAAANALLGASSPSPFPALPLASFPSSRALPLTPRGKYTLFSCAPWHQTPALSYSC